jgi:hypothetical protein
MRDLARAKTAGTYLIADVDEISAYEYRNEAIETVSTAVGELATYRVSQQRQGSTRHTLLWAAPELHYLPVRIEQRREGRSPVAFVLESVEWIDAPARPSP